MTTDDREKEVTGSTIFGMSVRGFLVTVLVFTVCAMSLLALQIAEPLYSAFMLALGFYFGQKGTENGNTK
jgi:hypothetical protein